MSLLVTLLAALMWWATSFTIAFALTGSRQVAVSVALVAGPIGGGLIGLVIGKAWPS